MDSLPGMRLLVAAAVCFAVSVVSAACKRAELTDREACDRIAVLRGTEKNAAEKDRCLAGYAAIGPNLKKCMNACVRSSKNGPDLTDCFDECHGGPQVPPFIVCQKKTLEGQAFDACVARHEALATTAPEVSKCWLRCGRRANAPAEVDACDVGCKVPPAP